MKREPTCKVCGAEKVALRSGILRCPACLRLWAREYYHKRLAAQNERCAICRRHWTACVAGKRSRYGAIFLQHLYVDHDHATGRVRGLLCNNCNAGIALFAEEAERLTSALAYLRKHKGV